MFQFHVNLDQTYYEALELDRSSLTIIILTFLWHQEAYHCSPPGKYCTSFCVTEKANFNIKLTRRCNIYIYILQRLGGRTQSGITTHLYLESHWLTISTKYNTTLAPTWSLTEGSTSIDSRELVVSLQSNITTRRLTCSTTRARTCRKLTG